MWNINHRLVHTNMIATSWVVLIFVNCSSNTNSSSIPSNYSETGILLSDAWNTFFSDPRTKDGASQLSGDGRQWLGDRGAGFISDKGKIPGDGNKSDSGVSPNGYHPGNDGKCRFARATNYPIARINGVPQGTCSFGPVAADMPQLFRDGFVTAPNEYFYNKSPAIAGACGECYEISGSMGTITVMAADICDIQCCDNCRGDVVAFDIEQSYWQNIVDQSGGNVSVAYRSVPCPVAGNIKAYFTSGYQAADRFRLVVYNYRIGIKSVEVKGAANKATKGTWTPLVRTMDNYFDWTGRGDVGLPITLRVISEQGQSVEFAPLTTPESNLRIVSLGQFTNLVPAGNACTWPGPEEWIYREKLEGILGLTWRDWGSYRLESGKPNYAFHTNCYSSTNCIDVGPITGWGAIQIGYPNFFPPQMFSAIELWARTSSGITSSISLFITGKAADGSDAVSKKIPLGTITTTWKKFSVPLSTMADQVARMRVVQISNQANPTSTGIVLDDIHLVR